ncbi:MAG: hypothetical protein H6814_08385 [Phycisphaeraceae bacterium]|nr:hypothetical protein [Phycisphaeraceae bacterium]
MALIHRTALVFAGAAAICASPLLAQNDQPRPQTIVAFESSTIPEILAHPKDAALRDALLMLPARLRELPREIPDLQQAPPGIFDLVDLAFQGPVRISIVSHGADPNTGMPRISGEIAFCARDKGSADAAQRALTGLVADVRELERQPDGSLAMQTPAGEIGIGVRQGDRGRWWLGARLGDQDAVADSYAALPPAPGGTRLMSGALNLESFITPMKMMGAMMAGGNPEAAAGMAMIDNLGVLDTLSSPMDAVCWSDDAGSHTRAVVHGARGSMQRMGAGEGLTQAQVNAIPADAMAASIGRMDLGALFGMLDQFKSMSPEAQEALSMFTEQTGVDLENDILRSLSGVFAFYSSDSTGGSGLMSWVMLSGVSDHDAMLGALTKLTNLANSGMQDKFDEDGTGRYLRIAHLREGGIDYLSFQTPGLPVPFSPTIAMAGDWLVVGVSRQSVTAAARQAAGKGDGGLLTSKAFRQQWPGSIEGAIKIQYLDTPRAIRKGYGLATLLGAMLENAVRSPLGADREPGMVIPSYNDLVRGARAAVQVVRFEGDDLVMTTNADGSTIVNLTGIGGAILEPIVLATIPAGILVPAIDRARERAREIIEEQEHAPGF